MMHAPHLREMHLCNIFFFFLLSTNGNKFMNLVIENIMVIYILILFRKLNRMIKRLTYNMMKYYSFLRQTIEFHLSPSFNIDFCFPIILQWNDKQNVRWTIGEVFFASIWKKTPRINNFVRVCVNAVCVLLVAKMNANNLLLSIKHMYKYNVVILCRFRFLRLAKWCDVNSTYCIYAAVDIYM